MKRFKETPEDIAIRDRLWKSTEAEALHFAAIEAAAFEVGKAYSDGQKDATSAAKAKGYPVWLIRQLGRAIRLSIDDLKDESLAAYREKIGLSA